MPSPHRQQGFAAIFIVLLTGLALAALLAGHLHRQYGQLELSRSLRGNSEAQLRAWTGAELLRQYLAQQTAGNIAQLVEDGGRLNLDASTLPPPLRSVASAIGLQLLEHDAAQQRARAQVVGVAGDARAVLEVVYQLNAATIVTASQHQFKGGLQTGGYIIAPQTDSEFNVDGAVRTAGTIGVARINATGSIDVPVAGGNGGRPLSLWSSQDISVGSGAFDALRAVGNIRMGNGSTVDTAVANGWAYSSGDRINELTTLGKSTTHSADLNSGSGVRLTGNVRISRALHSKFDVQLESSGEVAFLASEAAVTIPIDSPNVASGWYRHTLRPSPPKGRVVLEHQPAASFNTPPVSHVPDISPPHIHAYQYREQSNYRFYFSPAEESPERVPRIKVEVKNINNIPDGLYYLGKHHNEGQNFICSQINAQGECLASSGQLAVKFCADDANAGCLSGSRVGSWVFRSKSHAFPAGAALPAPESRDEAALKQQRDRERKAAAGIADAIAPLPGVILFEGDLAIAGLFRNTLLATGNITKSGGGDLYVWSLAEAEADVDSGYSSKGVCRGVDYAPRNHCSGQPAILNKAAPQHIALLAGTFDATQTPKASGGDISVSGRIYGAIMAGNKLTTSGSTLIAGFISALAQTDSGGTDRPNQLSAETTIVAPTQDGNGSNGNNGSSLSARLLWARYR